MRSCIVDCYTDEASGLGVPPYLGVYPRYVFGRLFSEGHDVSYVTIDDLRALQSVNKNRHKTDIKTYNMTRVDKDVLDIVSRCEQMIVICGVHVPGKYLSALPGTLHEVSRLVSGIKCRKILTGPAASSLGTRLEGGKKAEKNDLGVFDDIVDDFVHDYSEIAKAAVKGAVIVKQVPYPVIAEIETSRGCAYGKCSFCTEPLKHKLEFRKVKDIIAEVRALHKHGVKYFRLGKQSDLFSWSTSKMEELLSGVKKYSEVLHIDNVDPCNVTADKVKLVVKYCTPGNVAALGVESFDADVVKANNLNSNPETSLKAIRLINKYGAARGDNGLPKFLPGVNILFGLSGETRKTHERNMEYFQKILDEGLLLRRINVRQAALYPGTRLYSSKQVKNRKYYWKWRNEIRQKVDNEMLKRLVPVGTVLKDVRAEVYDGNNTFCRQFGTYPLIVGVKSRLDLGKFYDVKVVSHMLRSVTGEVL